MKDNRVAPVYSLYHTLDCVPAVNQLSTTVPSHPGSLTYTVKYADSHLIADVTTQTLLHSLEHSTGQSHYCL